MPPVAPFPAPPAELIEATAPTRGGGLVAPALDVEAWVRAEILAPDRPLSIYDHGHLTEHGARVAFLWSTEVETRGGRRTLGTCQTAEPTGRAWAQAQRRAQLVDWFGTVPTFLVVLDALHAAHALATGRPENVLAVVDHELCHAGIKTDAYGAPQFNDATGEPKWTVVPHTVEEFPGPVRRWGIEATGVGPLAEAIDYVREHGPDMAPATLDGLCGTCKRSLSVT